MFALTSLSRNFNLFKYTHAYATSNNLKTIINMFLYVLSVVKDSYPPSLFQNKTMLLGA